MRRKSKHSLAWAGFKFFLLGCVILLMGMSTYVYAATDCSPLPYCPGTAPAIWPNVTVPLNDVSTIYGWNLEPNTNYLLGIIKSEEVRDMINFYTSSDGDFLDTPVDFFVPESQGLLSVRLFGPDWNGDINNFIAETEIYSW